MGMGTRSSPTPLARYRPAPTHLQLPPVQTAPIQSSTSTKSASALPVTPCRMLVCSLGLCACPVGSFTDQTLIVPVASNNPHLGGGVASLRSMQQRTVRQGLNSSLSTTFASIFTPAPSPARSCSWLAGCSGCSATLGGSGSKERGLPSPFGWRMMDVKPAVLSIHHLKFAIHHGNVSS